LVLYRVNFAIEFGERFLKDFQVTRILDGIYLLDNPFASQANPLEFSYACRLSRG